MRKLTIGQSIILLLLILAAVGCVAALILGFNGYRPPL